jgi:hypothetical protein
MDHAGGGGGGASPDDEGSFLHPEVRAAVMPRLSLDTIAAVLERLDPRVEPNEPRVRKVQRQAAEALLRRRAREIARQLQ